jgi:hypothetical protein
VPHNPCPYFSLSVVKVPIPNQRMIMRMPVCRCGLSETMSERLRRDPDGEVFASYLEGRPLDGQPRPQLGADLQPVSPRLCTNERLTTTCVPSFVDTLTDCSLDASVPPVDTAPEEQA